MKSFSLPGEEWPQLSDADWKSWSNMMVVSLAEATLLSFNKEPTTEACHTSHFMPGPYSYHRVPANIFKRYILACGSLGVPKGLKHIEVNFRPDVPQHMPCVRLDEYGAWARRIGITLPSDFPVDDGQQLNANHDSVWYDLPYANWFIALLRRWMWKMHNASETQNPLKKYNVAKKIASEESKINVRIATSLASWIGADSSENSPS